MFGRSVSLGWEAAQRRAQAAEGHGSGLQPQVSVAGADSEPWLGGGAEAGWEDRSIGQGLTQGERTGRRTR